MSLPRRPCGSSGLTLPALGLGCWQMGGGDYWGPVEQKAVDAVVRESVELGANYFDNAEVYYDGRSEEALGKALAGLGRDSFIVGTKISPNHAQPENVPVHCEASLRRLGLDYVDIYMVHWPLGANSIRHYTDEAIDPPAVEDAFAALMKLRDEGKVRHIGVSNFAAPTLREALETGAAIAVNELPYNLLARAAEHEILDYCAENGVGVISYFALMQGLLTGRWNTLADVPAYQRRTRHFDTRGCELYSAGDAGAEAETRAAIDAARRIAEEAGMPVSELAVKWVLANEKIACTLVGTRSPERLRDNVRAASEPLSNDIVERLDEATKPLLDKLGPSFDYYQSAENDRTI